MAIRLLFRLWNLGNLNARFAILNAYLNDYKFWLLEKHFWIVEQENYFCCQKKSTKD